MSKFTRCFRICAVLLLLGAVFPAPGLEIPPLSGKIVDQAQVLQEQAPAIAAALEKLEAEKSCRTMITLGAAVMDRWTGEKPEADRGLLLLIAVKDRRIRVEVGPGLTDEWNDAAMERFLRAVQPGFREKKYGEAILAGLPVLAAAPEQAARKPAAPESSAQNRFPTGMIVIVAAVLAIFIYGAVRKNRSLRQNRKTRRKRRIRRTMRRRNRTKMTMAMAKMTTKRNKTEPAATAAAAVTV